MGRSSEITSKTMPATANNIAALARAWGTPAASAIHASTAIPSAMAGASLRLPRPSRGAGNSAVR